MREFNVVLAGVGGQGTLLAAEILGLAAVEEGLNVRVSEIHGMAQRGGAVVSDVRIGKSVLAPTILNGQADVLLGFEPLETLRSLRLTSEKTLVIMNDVRIAPPELTAKKVEYPALTEIEEKIRVFTKKLIVVDAARLAKDAGNVLAQNVVLLGVLAGSGDLPMKEDNIVKALQELVPQKHLDVNVKAFKLGYEYAKKKRR